MFSKHSLPFILFTVFQRITMNNHKKQTNTKWTSAFKSYRCNAEQERAGMLRIMLQWMCACGGQCRSQWGGEEAHTHTHTNTCKHTKERLTGTCRTGMREECQLTSPPLSCPSPAAPRLLCRRPQWRHQLRGLHADSQWNSGSVWHISHPCGIFVIIIIICAKQRGLTLIQV